MEKEMDSNIVLDTNDVAAGKKASIPFLAVLMGAIIIVIAFFLPYASAKKEHKEYLKYYYEEVIDTEANMTGKDAIHVSMFEFAKIYHVADGDVATFCLIVIIIIGIFSLLTLLFVLLKKPIVVLVFDCLTFASYHLLTSDFKMRGAMPNWRYAWGISYYLYYIGIVIVLVGVIWMLITKIKQKKQRKSEII